MSPKTEQQILMQLEKMQKDLAAIKQGAHLQLLTMADLEEITKFSVKHIYNMINDGTFPKQTKFGTASRWKLTEVEAWANGDWTPQQAKTA